MGSTQLVIEDYEGARTVVPLDTDSVTIGRASGHLIQLTEQNVSRDHAKVYLHDEGWIIEDLGSFNGIRVNNVPISGPVILREGDLVTIGDYTMQLVADAARDTVEIFGGGAAATEVGAGFTLDSSSRLPKTSSSEDSGETTVSNDPDVVAAPVPPVAADAPASGAATAGAAAAGFDDDGGLDEFDLEEGGGNGKWIVLGLIGVVAAVAAWKFMGGEESPKKATPAAVAAKKAADNDPPPEVQEAAGEDANAAADTTGAADGDPAADATGAAGDPAAGETGEAGEAAAEDEAEAEAPAPTPTPRKTTKKRRRSTTTSSAAASTSPEPEPEPEPEPAPAPAPAPEPETQTPKAAPAPVAPSKSASELLDEARKAAFGGNPSKAYDLAKQSNAKSSSADAVQLMAVSACKMGSASKAQSAYSRLSDKRKKSVRSLCESKGIELK